MSSSYRVKVNLPTSPAHEKFVESQRHSFSLDARKSDDARALAKAKVQAMGFTVRGVQIGPDNTVIVNAYDPATMGAAVRKK
jgi:hypothetical protein